MWERCGHMVLSTGHAECWELLFIFVLTAWGQRGGKGCGTGVSSVRWRWERGVEKLQEGHQGSGLG